MMEKVAAPSRSGSLRRGKVAQELHDLRPHPLAMDDRIDQAVLLKEFGGLKTLRQILVRRFLDYALAGETDHGSGFGNDDVA